MSEAPAANGGRAAGRRLERLLRAEQRAGLRVALLGRLAVIAVFALYIVTTRVPPTVYYMTGIAAAFGAMALVQLALLRRVDARHWSMYLFAALDVVFLVVAIVFFAGPMTPLWRAMTSPAASKYSSSIATTSPGGIRSAIPVKPAMSVNITVASPCLGASAPSASIS